MIENFLYKIIHIENCKNIIDELSLYTYNHIPDELGQSRRYFGHLNLQDVLNKCPSINEWFNQKKIRPRVCALIGVIGDDRKGIHIDHQKQSLALNFGIIIPEGSFTGLYKLESDLELFETKQPNGIPSYKFDNSAEFSLIDKFDLHMPTMFNTQVPHGVFSPIGEKRISISFRFVEDPWELIE